MAKSRISVGNKGIYFYSISSEFDMISLLIQLIKSITSVKEKFSVSKLTYLTTHPLPLFTVEIVGKQVPQILFTVRW